MICILVPIQKHGLFLMSKERGPCNHWRSPFKLSSVFCYVERERGVYLTSCLTDSFINQFCSMNLYELIKKNNFQGFSLALIRRWVILIFVFNKMILWLMTCCVWFYYFMWSLLLYLAFCILCYIFHELHCIFLQVYNKFTFSIHRFIFLS